MWSDDVNNRFCCCRVYALRRLCLTSVITVLTVNDSAVCIAAKERFMLYTRFIQTNSDSAWLLRGSLKQIQIRCDNSGLCSKKAKFDTIVVDFVHTDPDFSWSVWALFKQAQIIYCNCGFYFKKFKSFVVNELTRVNLTVGYLQTHLRALSVGCVQTGWNWRIYFFFQVVLHSPQNKVK
jgi:hypothetical protein